MKRKSVLKDELEKPSKEEYAVAKVLKFQAPNKEGRFQGNSVQYFMGSKIVDFLMDSKWGKNSKNPLFTTRMSCVLYCARLLEKGFFHRAEKPEKKEKSKKAADKSNKETTPATAKKRGKKREEGDEADKTENTQEPVSPPTEEKRKRKRVVKLRQHQVQQFIDGPHLYVWIYDPVPVKTFIIGLLLVVGVIGVCLFPLWPPEIKVGIYYLSCAAIGFIGFIFALCIIRVVVWLGVWLGTLGAVSLWLLPNLTEDVGFFDSFKPLYKLDTKEKVGENGTVEKGEKKEYKRENDRKVEGENEDKAKDEEGGDVEGGEDDEDDKNTNSSNGYEIVNAEDYEFETENKEDDYSGEDDDDRKDEDDDDDRKDEDDDEEMKDDDDEEMKDDDEDEDDSDANDASTKKVN